MVGAGHVGDRRQRAWRLNPGGRRWTTSPRRADPHHRLFHRPSRQASRPSPRCRRRPGDPRVPGPVDRRHRSKRHGCSRRPHRAHRRRGRSSRPPWRRQARNRRPQRRPPSLPRHNSPSRRHPRCRHSRPRLDRADRSPARPRRPGAGHRREPHRPDRHLRGGERLHPAPNHRAGRRHRPAGARGLLVGADHPRATTTRRAIPSASRSTRTSE
jgi:hypothetical protein